MPETDIVAVLSRLVGVYLGFWFLGFLFGAVVVLGVMLMLAGILAGDKTLRTFGERCVILGVIVLAVIFGGFLLWTHGLLPTFFYF